MYEEVKPEIKATKRMAFTIKIEEFAFSAISIYFLSRYNLGLLFWTWVLLFFSPDISALAYLVSPLIGAYGYNLFHNRAIAIALIAVGLFTHVDLIKAMGILLLAHSSFDRMMGYGLKYTDDFKHTNLGWIGKKSSRHSN
jgi:hypothetical protein